MKRAIRRLYRPAALAGAVLLFAAMPGVALAQTDEDVPTRDLRVTDRPLDDRPDHDRGLDAVKERLSAAIERRLEALERMSEAVDDNDHVSADHAAHLQNDYREATRLLEAALEDIEDAETFEELREIVPEVFEETLVFALLEPKTHLVLASHSMVAFTGRLSGLSDTFQAIIDRLAAQGHDMAAAQAALDEMTGLIADAAATSGPVAASVIGVDQGDWPDPAKSVLESGRSDLQDARGLLREARAKVREMISAIREALTG